VRHFCEFLNIFNLIITYLNLPIGLITHKFELYQIRLNQNISRVTPEPMSLVFI
jgi:hypothetical protein